MADGTREARVVATTPALRRELSLFDAIAIVVGTTIGSGIFLIPSSIATHLNGLGPVLAVWILGGILTVLGALSLAELAAMYPGTGGLATYLRHAYGRLTAFLYAWGLLFMIHSGSIAAVAVAFGLYAGQLFALTVTQEKLLSGALILTLTAVSYIGVRSSKLVQNLIASAKVTGLAAMILAVCLLGTRPLHLLEPLASGASPALWGVSLAGFGIALVAVLWSYEGWHLVSFVGGEMKVPQRDLPRSLYVGTAIVMTIYLTANLGYYHVLSSADIRGSNAVAALAVGTVVGPVGTKIISILILVSVTGTVNGMILTGPRVYYAMARDGAFLRSFGHVSERYRTPTVALVVQGIWATVLALSGSYQDLFTDVIFTAWIFYGLAAAGVIVLRRTQPDLPRPFRVPGYPWVPLTFSVAAAGLLVSTLVARPVGGLIGLTLVGAGIPVYLFGSSRFLATANQAPDSDPRGDEQTA
jgi:basic amino acid/polyamine antiporter, APA family